MNCLKLRRAYIMLPFAINFSIYFASMLELGLLENCPHESETHPLPDNHTEDLNHSSPSYIPDPPCSGTLQPHHNIPLTSDLVSFADTGEGLGGSGLGANRVRWLW